MSDPTVLVPAAALTTPEREAQAVVAATDVAISPNERVIELSTMGPFALKGIAQKNKCDPDEKFTILVHKVAKGVDMTTEFAEFIDLYPNGLVYFGEIERPKKKPGRKKATA